MLKYIATRRFNYVDVVGVSIATAAAAEFGLVWWVVAVIASASLSVIIERRTGVAR